MIATLLGTLFLPLQFAVLAGIITSILRFIIKTSTPQVHAVVPDSSFKHFVKIEEGQQICPQLGIINISGPLYFGAVNHVEQIIHKNKDQHPEQRYLLLRMHLVDHLDVSGVHMLESIIRLYRQQHGDVFLSGLHKPLLEQIRAIGFDKALGRDHFFDRETSISHIFHHVLEPSICIYECEARVFAECQALPKWTAGAKTPDLITLPEYHIESWLPSQLKLHLSHAGNLASTVIVDVREPSEYSRGHIAAAQLLPLRNMAKQGDALPPDKTIVLVCRIGRRSRMAAVILKNMGYENVYNLQGGILAWEAAGYPLAVE